MISTGQFTSGYLSFWGGFIQPLVGFIQHNNLSFNKVNSHLRHLSSSSQLGGWVVGSRSQPLLPWNTQPNQPGPRFPSSYSMNLNEVVQLLRTLHFPFSSVRFSPMQWANSSNLSDPKKISGFPFTWYTNRGKPKAWEDFTAQLNDCRGKGSTK